MIGSYKCDAAGVKRLQFDRTVSDTSTAKNPYERFFFVVGSFLAADTMRRSVDITVYDKIRLVKLGAHYFAAQYNLSYL